MSKTPLKIDTITEQLAAARRQTAGSRPLNDVKCSGGDGSHSLCFFCSSSRGGKKEKIPKRVMILENLSFRSCFLHLPGSDPQPRRLGPLLPIRPTAHLAASSSLTPRRGGRGAAQMHRCAPAPLLLFQLAGKGFNMQRTLLNASSTGLQVERPEVKKQSTNALLLY